MISSQAIVFLYSMLVGAILTFIFDLFRIWRMNFKTPSYLVIVQDIIFLFIVMITIVSTSFLYNNGEIRGYMVLGYLMGLMFYLLVFHKIMVTVLSGILQFLKKLCMKVLNLLKNMTSKQKNLKKS